MIDGISRLDDPTLHPFTAGCGDPERCWACGCYFEEHVEAVATAPKPDHNAHLGAKETSR